MTLHRPASAHHLRLLRIAVAGLLLAGAMSGTAVAGKPPPGGTASSGSCSVTPNPVAIGAEYTMTAVNLGTNRSVNIFISGSGGTNSFFRYTGSTGSVSVTWYANWSGTNTVAVKMPDGRKSVTLATCSFTVT